MRSERGQTLFELVAALAVFGTLSCGAVRGAEAALRGVALMGATAELRTLFAEVRMQAMARERSLAIEFREAGDGWSWSVYEDRAVRSDEVRLQGPRRVEMIGVPAGNVPDPLQPGALLATRPPVRFGRSTRCKFSPHGEATDGWVVLTDGTRAAMLHIDGPTGRVDVFRWNGARWRVEE